MSQSRQYLKGINMTHSAIKETGDLISISEYENRDGYVKDLLMKASRSELLLYVALRPHSSKLVAIANHEKPQQGSNQTKGVIYAPLLPHYAELIAEFGEAVIEQYEASVDGKEPLDWHYWVLDASQTVTIDQVKIDKASTCQSSSDPNGENWTSEKIEEIKTASEKPWNIIEPNDPTPKQHWYTPARYFARQLVKVDSTLLTKRKLLAKKVAQSLTNCGFLKRGGVKPLNPATVEKAFNRVSLG